MSKKYTKEYFVKKFEAIPEEEIGRGDLDKHCALYHCGVTSSPNYNHTEESKALAILLGGDEDFMNVWEINDDRDDIPKNNILNALKLL